MFEMKPAAAVRQTASKAKRWVRAGALALAATGVAAVVYAQGMPPAPPMMHGGPGMGMMFGAPEHMGRGIDHLLDGLGATEAQRTQIKQIAMAAAADLRRQHEAERAMHDQAIQIFAAPTIDASAAEALRQQMQAQHDQASKRILQAMLDASKVLTPEQRLKLAQRAHERELIMQDRMQRERAHEQQRPKP